MSRGSLPRRRNSSRTRCRTDPKSSLAPSARIGSCCGLPDRLRIHSRCEAHRSRTCATLQRGLSPMNITRQATADTLAEYLHGNVGQVELVDRAGRAVIDGEFEEAAAEWSRREVVRHGREAGTGERRFERLNWLPTSSAASASQMWRSSACSREIVKNCSDGRVSPHRHRRQRLGRGSASVAHCQDLNSDPQRRCRSDQVTRSSRSSSRRTRGQS